MANFFFENRTQTEPHTGKLLGLLCGMVMLLFASAVAAQSPFEGNTTGRKTEPVPPANVEQNLAGIKVEGNISIPSSSIMAHIKSHPHRPADPSQVREDLNALFHTGWFQNVRSVYRATEAGPILVFQVVERPIIKSVEYRGNKKIKNKHLAANTGLKPGGAFNVRDNKASATRLNKFYHEKGFRFATVKLIKGDQQDDRSVIFVINEGPRVRVTKIKLTGNKFFTDSVLRLKLQTKKAILWKFSGLYDPATIPADMIAIKEYYHSLGFFDVQVKHDITFSKSREFAKIEYTIKEGLRYKIRNVEIAGNRIWSDKTLREKAELHSGDFFNLRKINKDALKIKERYGKRGHLFATVEAKPRFLETPGKADLVLQINEDKPYVIRKINVNIRGDYPHTRSNIVRNPATIYPGAVADPKEIARTKSRIAGTQLFESSGPQGVQINLVPVKKTAQRRKVFRGQSGELGNPFTEEATQNNNRQNNNNGHYQPPANPFRELKTAPLIQRGLREEPSSKSNVFPTYPQPQREEKTSRLENPFRTAVGSEAVPKPYQNIQQQSFTDNYPKSTSPFSGLSPQGDPLDNAFQGQQPNWLDVEINATEARTGRLMFGVGVNSDAGVVGSIVLDERNFDIMRPPRRLSDLFDGTAWRGGGEHFRLEAVPGSDVSRYMINWTNPYFMDTNYSLGLSGFYFSRFYQDWTEQRVGGRVSVGRQFTPFFSLRAALRLEQVDVSNPVTPAPAELTAAVGENLLSTIKLNATYDQRDSSFLPSEGYILQAGYEQAVGDFSYPRFNVEANKYWTVWSRPDGAGKHIVSLGGEASWTGSDTPIFEKFYAGGFSSFRGFDFRGIGPDVGGVKTGGKFMALGSVEYRFPIMANEMIHGVVFSDFGTVENSAGFEDFRATAGGGVRIMVPAMGPVPLAFDWAVPILSSATDEERLFSFYIGFTR